MQSWCRFWARWPNSPQQTVLFRAVYWWFSTPIFQTHKQGWKTHLHVFPYWQDSKVSKTSPLNYHCKSSKLVLCTCRLQLASGLAFLRGKRAVNSHSCLQLKTSETALWLYSARGKSWIQWQPLGPARLAWQSSLMCFAGKPRVPAHPPTGAVQEFQPSCHSPSAMSEFRPSVHVAWGLLAVVCLHWSYNIKQWHGSISIL